MAKGAGIRGGALALMAMIIMPEAHSASYNYDSQGRLVTVTYANGTRVYYSYDAAGNRTQRVVSTANMSPSAVNDAIETPEGQAYRFDPRANDSDPDGDPLTIVSKTDGAHGAVQIENGVTLKYTPASNYYGSDSFTYTLGDDRGGTSAGATVNVTVWGQPDAVNDTLTVTYGSILNEGLECVVYYQGWVDLLSNDTDPANATLQVTADTIPPNSNIFRFASEVTFEWVGYTWLPSPLPSSFTYSISNGSGGTDSATVNIVYEPGGSC